MWNELENKKAFDQKNASLMSGWPKRCGSTMSIRPSKFRPEKA
jgi:hypothetical protein